MHSGSMVRPVPKVFICLLGLVGFLFIPQVQLFMGSENGEPRSRVLRFAGVHNPNPHKSIQLVVSFKGIPKFMGLVETVLGVPSKETTSYDSSSQGNSISRSLE